VVGVARAVHVRVVPRLRLVLHVRGRNRDPARLLFRRTVNRVVRAELAAKTFRAHLRQRRRQRRLAVVNVTDRAHVHVGLGALELVLCHGCVSRNWSGLRGIAQAPRGMPLNWCSRMESNHRPPPYQGGALPTELRERVACNGLCCLYWCHAAAGGAMERETGIEPAPSAWKAEVLPLNYSRAVRCIWWREV